MADQPDDLTATSRSCPWPHPSEEDRFAHVVEASPTALVLVRQDGRIDMVNRQTERMFGYARAALVGRPLEVLVPERFRQQHAALRRDFQAHGSSRLVDAGLALYGRRADGSEFPLEVGLNPIALDGQRMVVAGIVDISARRRSEQERERQRAENRREREQQQRELERSNADLEEFAYVASHDLKAPLRAIQHLAQWIREDVETTAKPETIENLHLLEGRVTRLQMLLDGLLAYSRVGRSQAEPETVDVAELVEDVAALLAAPGFDIACAGDQPTLRTHRIPLRVVLENLIGNGIKHHDRAHGRIVVAMRRIGDGMAEFRVSDDGPGIPERYHDRIFVIFQTLASRDEVESSGIGLALVKKKVLSHGGTIRVESAPPARGTTFVFTWQESPP